VAGLQAELARQAASLTQSRRSDEESEAAVQEAWAGEARERRLRRDAEALLEHVVREVLARGGRALLPPEAAALAAA
jgi:hypothetical protein